MNRGPSFTHACHIDRDPRARRCRVYRSGSLSGNSTAGSTDSASDVALEETNPLLESDQVPEGTMTTGTKHSADCWCSTACFPLRLVFRASQPPIPSDLVVGLLMWAKSMAWSNICNAHLGRLGELRFGASVKSWSRDEIASQLEIVLSEVRLSKGDLMLPPSEDNLHRQNLTSAEDQSQLPSPPRAPTLLGATLARWRGFHESSTPQRPHIASVKLLILSTKYASC